MSRAHQGSCARAYDALPIQDEDSPLRRRISSEPCEVLVEDSVRLHDLPVIVTEQREVEHVHLVEGLVGEGVVDAYPYDLGVQGLKVRQGIPESTHLSLADRGERPRIEGEDHLFSLELIKAPRLHLYVDQGELWGSRSDYHTISQHHHMKNEVTMEYNLN